MVSSVPLFEVDLLGSFLHCIRHTQSVRIYQQPYSSLTEEGQGLDFPRFPLLHDDVMYFALRRVARIQRTL